MGIVALFEEGSASRVVLVGIPGCQVPTWKRSIHVAQAKQGLWGLSYPYTCCLRTYIGINSNGDFYALKRMSLLKLYGWPDKFTNNRIQNYMKHVISARCSLRQHVM